jgi:hypothetical protein
MQLERWRWRAARAATVLFVCVLPHSAHADCIQKDIEGRWRVYADVSDRQSAHWLTCTLSVGESGVISDGRCDGPGQKNLQITTGKIEIEDTTNCAFSGYLEVNETPNHIDHATLSPEKTFGSGVGSYRDGFFTFTMIKTGNP